MKTDTGRRKRFLLPSLFPAKRFDWLGRQSEALRPDGQIITDPAKGKRFGPLAFISSVEDGPRPEEALRFQKLAKK